MAKVPTVKIEGHSDYIIINEKDFDENEHTLIEETDSGKPVEIEDKVSKAKSTKKAAKSSIDSAVKKE